MKSCRLFLAVATIFSVAGCGGGSGNGDSSGTTQPSVSPVITSVTPTNATVGAQTTFTVSGTNLTSGMAFSLTNCAGTTSVAGGTSTMQQFSCTPTGPYGIQQGNIYATAGATTSLYNVQVSFQSPVMSVSSSGLRNAVVTPDGSLYVWGSYYFQGDGNTSGGVSKPTKIGTGFQSVAEGEQSTIAIKKDGTLWSWGADTDSTLGNGSSSFAAVAAPVQVGSGYVQVVYKGAGTNGGENVVALKSDGTIWVWGCRASSTPNSPDSVYAPQMIPGSGYVGIASGDQGGMLAWKSDGSLWSWSRNLSTTPFVPVQVGSGFVSVTSGYSITIGLKADGSLWNLTYNGTTPGVIPVLIGDGFQSLSNGAGLALKTDGSLWNVSGGTAVSLSNQVGTGYIAASVGDTCSYAQKPDGTLWAWGICDFGDGKGWRYGPSTPLQIVLGN